MFIGIGIVALIISAYNFHLFTKRQSEISDYKKKISVSQKKWQNNQQLQHVKKTEIGEEEKEVLKNNAVFLNRLIASDIFPWNQFLNMLERKVPNGLTLNKIEPEDNYSKLILAGYAGSTRKITFFMKRLKDWNVIQQSTLLKLHVEDNGSQPKTDGKELKIEFEIESTLRTEKLFSETGLGRVGKVFVQSSQG